MKTLPVIAAVTGLAVLSACAPSRVPYVHPTLPRDQAADDYSACKRWADDQIDPTRGAADAQRLDTALARADRDDMRRRLAQYVRACMESKGYKPGTANY